MIEWWELKERGQFVTLYFVVPHELCPCKT